jgi:hypothetical protein
MARRQTEVLRNLDDNLKVLNFLTFKSCGFVVMFYSLCYALELVFGAFSLVFGALGVIAQFGATAVFAVFLSWVERHEDEHYVPSAVRYYCSRPWRVLYAGAHATAGERHQVMEVLRGR